MKHCSCGRYLHSFYTYLLSYISCSYNTYKTYKITFLPSHFLFPQPPNFSFKYLALLTYLLVYKRHSCQCKAKLIYFLKSIIDTTELICGPETWSAIYHNPSMFTDLWCTFQEHNHCTCMANARTEKNWISNNLRCLYGQLIIHLLT